MDFGCGFSSASSKVPPDCGCLCAVQFNTSKVGSAAEEDSWGSGLRKQGAAGRVLSQTHLSFTKLRERE